MGKLLHKLVHGITPSWLFTGFRWTNTSSKKLLHFRPRWGICSKYSATTLSSSSAPLDTQLVYLLMDMDQSTHYYSQSEGEPEKTITGNSNHIPSPSIESKSHDDDNEDDDDDSRNPRTGICALAATSIIKGRWHDNKHEPSPFANKEIKYPTSPASIDLQSQHDNDDHQHSHQQEGCLDHPYPVEHQTRNLTRETGVLKEGHHDNGHHQHQHQPQHDENHQQCHVVDGGAHVNQSLQNHADDGPHTNQHHAADGSLCQHDDDVHHHAHNDHHAYEYHHHGELYGSNNQLRTRKHGRKMADMGSQPLAMSTETGTQHNYGDHHPHHRQHHNQCQNNDLYHQHNASNVKRDYHQPHLGGFKRKSIYLDEDDGQEDGNDESNYSCSIREWSCFKRQKTQKEGNVTYELPECICEMMGNGSAVVQYSYRNPQFAFWESMVEMIVANELWGVAELEFLLHCYLALNDPHLHHTICTSFLQVLKDLQQSLHFKGFPLWLRWIK